jgi:hypothetical protein
MKNSLTSAIVLVSLFSLLLIAASMFTINADMSLLAKDKALKVLINGKEVDLKPLESGDTVMIPLHFPLQDGESTWQVTMDYNKDKGTVTINKALTREKLRGDTICPRCGGNGRCQSCYPAGSGRNINGTGPCYGCDGTGKCFYCNGNGSY